MGLLHIEFYTEMHACMHLQSQHQSPEDLVSMQAPAGIMRSSSRYLIAEVGETNLCKHHTLQDGFTVLKTIHCFKGTSPNLGSPLKLS